MKRYLNMPDTRPLDDWGVPIGAPYEKKDWAQLTPEEMMADFEWKSDILSAFGDELSCSTFYQDYLFRELYHGDLEGDYKVVVTEYDGAEGGKVSKVDVDDIEQFLLLDDVALSPCLFYKNWRRKDLMNYVSAFVMDVDKVRPMHLQRFFTLFSENRLLTPTFIANSGSGVHFYYLLDRMLPCDSVQHEANRLIAEQIYKNLYDDIIKKEKWSFAQRHWIGQDYRVVNSKTRLHQISKVFKVGDVYSVEQLVAHYGITIEKTKQYASKKQIKYASNIAKDLKIDPPDYSDAKKTYDFIREHKDAAYQVRMERKAKREASKSKRRDSSKESRTWYRRTLEYMIDNTEAGHRFGSMKALAIIAFKEQIPRDVFLRDLEALVAYWEHFDWNGDSFNSRNVPAIIRLFDNASRYSNTSSETLEEWLGYTFQRLGNRRNGLSRRDHLEEARAIRDIRMKRQGKDWRDGNGRPSSKTIVHEWRQSFPDGKKVDCIRDTGLSKPTVYKWWDA